MYLYNPKLAAPAHLEKMLIGRRDIADWLEKVAILFAETGKATHCLCIGNRGMGKSHLINALYHRLQRAEAVRKSMVVAFLDEDPYGIASYFDLLRHIITVIAKRSQSPVDKQQLLDALKTLIGIRDEKQLIANAERILTAHLVGRRLLLLAENLNVILEALGAEGQGRWRDFLQTHDNTMICATAQAIFSDVQQRERPFFGFFHVTYLQKLRYEEARDLLWAMTEGVKHKELIAYIETPEGEAKLRAVFELTEGNHRLLVAFYEFFIAEFRSELSKSFLRTLDQLKPYYESFLKVLPPQQQKIVQFLVSERVPQPGRTIADNCFLPINTLSKQMSELQRLGYVQNTRQGRDAYYEITEPMLRMCLEANENTDGILSIFVDFLGNLYPIPDLKFHTLRFLLFSKTAPDTALRTKMAEEAHLYKKAAKRYANREPDTQELLEAREAPVYEQEQTMRRLVEDSEFESYADKFYDLLTNLLVEANQMEQAEQVVQQMAERYEGNPFAKLGLLLHCEILIGRTGEDNRTLQQLSNIKKEIGEGIVLFIIFLIISLQPKHTMLEVLKNKYFQTFLKTCEKGVLPQTLQTSIKRFLRSNVSSTQLHDFHAALTEVFGQKTSMRYPLKFLHLGIRYVRENDPKALLELTLEERRVFEREVLGKEKV